MCREATIERAALRRLYRDIIDSQTREIDQMNTLLRDRR
jgi:uncharacterized protein (DUF305 family)